jgi:hypothetical protein
MFEKIGRLAETAANKVSVSRRGFLGRLGQGALAVGALLGGITASASAQTGGVLCCIYQCPKCPGGPKGGGGGKFIQCSTTGSCYGAVVGGCIGSPDYVVCTLTGSVSKPNCYKC